MSNEELAAMARHDCWLIQNVINERTPDLGMKQVGPELIRRLEMYAAALS